ncbi:MAG: alpha/beta hydrolase [Odoribacter sp.]
MKRNLFKSLILCVLLGYGMNIRAQEKFPLWPQGPKESNRLKDSVTMNDEGCLRNNSEAELFVYHPAEGNNTGMSVLICPGGGYTQLSMKQEGELFARWLTERGITAFVLQYRMPNGHSKIPLTDAARALRWVRSRTEEWDLKPNKIGIAGFSAGGHLASTLATHFNGGDSRDTDRLERLSCRPDFVLLFYPVISMTNGLTHSGSKKALLGKNPSAQLIHLYSNERHITAHTPPTFIIHCDDDATVSSLNSIAYYQALKQHKVPAVLYIFPQGGHGWGLWNHFEYYPQWTNLLAKWLKKIE